MFILLTWPGEESVPSDVFLELKKEYDQVIWEDWNLIPFLTQWYYDSHPSAGPAELQEYLSLRSGTVELTAIDDIRGDVEFIRLIVIPFEGLVVDVPPEEESDWRPLLERVKTSLGLVER